MRIYDITQELFSAPVYPGDPWPERTLLTSITGGDDYNLSTISACCHTGTHLDAPLHCIPGGKSITDVPLENLIGPCTVVTVQSLVTAPRAKTLCEGCANRLLLRTHGRPLLTAEGASVFAEHHLTLLGIDAISLSASEGEELQVHRILCGAGIPLLEGLDLAQVPDGSYFLTALPMKLDGSDGAPVRAVLFSPENGRTDENNF